MLRRCDRGTAYCQAGFDATLTLIGADVRQSQRRLKQKPIQSLCYENTLAFRKTLTTGEMIFGCGERI